jgi:hypothetical protein
MLKKLTVSRASIQQETISWNAQRSFCATVNDLQR